MKWLKEKPLSYNIFLVVLVLFFVYYGYSTGKADLNDLPQEVQDSPLFAAFREEYMYSPKEGLLGDFNGDGQQDLAILYSAGLSWKMVVVVGGGEPPAITEPVPAYKESPGLAFDPDTGYLTVSGTKDGSVGLEDLYQLVDGQLQLVDSYEFNL